MILFNAMLMTKYKKRSIWQMKEIDNYSVNGLWWKLQVGSKEQQTSHSQRFLILFLLFFWMVYTIGHCSSLRLLPRSHL